MLNFIQAEFYKLKRSKLIFVVLLGLFAPGLLMFTGLVFGNIGPQKMEYFLSSINMYGLMMFNAIVFVLLASYLIVIEYNDHTLKSVLTIPISKTNFVLGKFAVFMILVGLFTVVNFVFMVILGSIGGTTDINLDIILKYFVQFLVGNLLLGISLTPFIFLSLLFKNVVPIVIGGVFVSLSNMFISESTYSPLSPFNSPYLIATNTLSHYSYGTVTPVLIIIVTAVVGLILSLIYFNKTDVYL